MTLEQLLEVVEQDSITPELIDVLVNVRDFLDYQESLSLADEIQDILYAVGILGSDAESVVDYYGLMRTTQSDTGHAQSLDLGIRRLVLSCKRAWSPAVFAAIRQFPALFTGPVQHSTPASARDVNEPEGTITYYQAERLKRFFGVRFLHSQSHASEFLSADHQQPAIRRNLTEQDIDAAEDPVEEDPESHVHESVDVLKKTSTVGSGSIESEHVREIVQKIVEHNDMRLGVISVSLVISKAEESGVRLSMNRLEAMVGRLSNIHLLDEDWIGRTGEVGGGIRLLIEQAASQVLSVIDQIPIDILHAQLGRINPTYARMSTQAIFEYYAAHPHFRIDGNTVRAARSKRYLSSTEVEPLELSLWRMLSTSVLPLSAGDMITRYSGRPKLKPGPRDRILRSSPLFVKTDGGYYAIGTSPALHATIRSETAFISTPILPVDDEFLVDFAETEPEPDENEKGSELDSVIVIPENEPVTEENENENEPESGSEIVVAEPDRKHEENDAWSDFYLAEEQPDEYEKFSDSADAIDSTPPEPRAFGETRTEVVSLRELLSQVINGELRIPEIQRSYVWKPAQVKDLFDSLYNGFPIGTLLVWETEQRLMGKRLGSSKYHEPSSQHGARFLLDGQQRTTSISQAIEGRGPRLYFNALDEHGSFRTSTRIMEFSARSIPVAGLDRETVDSLLAKSKIKSEDSNYPLIRKKLEHLIGILDRKISVETLHGFDYGEATDIFIRVNSRGTKLKNAELAIANLAYRLPGTVGRDIQAFSETVSAKGWDFPVPFIIRLITATATQRVSFSALNAVDDDVILRSWKSVQSAVEAWLDLLGNRLGLVTEDVLVGKNSHIVPITWLAINNQTECSHRLLYWFVLSGVFSRYTGRTDSNLDQDLRFVSNSDEKEMVDHLLVPLRSRRSTLRVEPLEVELAGRQSGLRLLMYLANLHLASSNLFATNRVADIQEPPVPAPIFPNKTLRSIGFSSDDRWVNDGGLVNSVYLDPGFEGDDLVSEARTLRSEHRYQHGLPIIGVYRSSAHVHEFLGQRSRLLVDQFNDVLTALEIGHLNIRPVELASKPSTRGRRELDHRNLPFDHTRRMMYDTIRRRILEIDPSVAEIETGVYIGFARNRNDRPFLCIAKRKSVLAFTADVDLHEVHDSKGICRDVSSVGRHGIGNTGFTIRRMDEVASVFGIIEQVMDMRT